MRATLRTVFAAILGIGIVTPVQGEIEIISHRGANTLAPENTLAAQRLAYELGSDTVECDVRLSKDKVPVIMHDHDLDRTTNGTGLIASKTLLELKQLDAGSKFSAQFAGEQIPTLAEMLEVAKAYNRNLILDIKGQGIATQVVQVIKTSGISLRQIRFLTWWREMSAEYVSLMPAVKVFRIPTVRATGAYISPDQITSEDLEAFRLEGVDVLCFSFGYASLADIRRFHAAGFEASLIYSPRTAAFLYEDAGLHSFWTDFTDTTVSGLRRMSQQWANWADASGLSPDQRRTWQDADGDGLSNLAEYALSTDPLQPDQRAAPVSGFQTAGNSTSSTTATSIDWTVDLRENWSQFLNVIPQVSTGNDIWTDLPANCCSTITPTQMLFKFPVGTSGRKFYRLKFDVKQE